MAAVIVNVQVDGNKKVRCDLYGVHPDIGAAVTVACSVDGVERTSNPNKKSTVLRRPGERETIVFEDTPATGNSQWVWITVRKADGEAILRRVGRRLTL